VGYVAGFAFALAVGYMATRHLGPLVGSLAGIAVTSALAFVENDLSLSMASVLDLVIFAVGVIVGAAAYEAIHDGRSSSESNGIPD
jgi:hypothetical protein